MINRILNAVTALGFLVLAGGPLLRFSPDPWSDPLEKRNSAPAPAIPTTWGELLNFTAAFEAFFNDHFGFRQKLIYFRNQMDFWVFNRSPAPLVLIGRHDWLFFTGAESLNDYMGKVTISEDNLETWYRALKTRRDWLAAQGIDYHFVVAPNKQTLYPEYMPRSVVRGHPTQKEQLIAYLAKHGEASLIEDMTPALSAAKGGLPLYHPLDTHWNPYGGYFGYRALVESMMRNNPDEVRPLKLGADQFGEEQTQLGDLASMMKFKRYPFRATDTTYVGQPLNCGQPVDVSKISVINPRARDDVLECGQVDAKARAIIFNDSMIKDLQPYLKESFSRLRITQMIPTFTDIKTYVRAEHPKVVVEERMERQMIIPPERPSMATATLTNALPPTEDKGGSVDVSEADGDIIISGFSKWLPDQPGAEIKVNTNLPVEEMALEGGGSDDVAEAFHDKHLNRSRFTLRLYLGAGRPKPEAIRLCLWTEDPVYGPTRFFFDNNAAWDSCPAG
jgi:hypothetical protein